MGMIRFAGLGLSTLVCLALMGCFQADQGVRKPESVALSNAAAWGKDSEVLQRAVDHLRNDDVKWNCHAAMYYLYQRREEIWPFLVRNLGTEDLQAKDAIIRILCETDPFTPDADFIRLVMDRIDKRGGLLSLEAHHSTHYDFIAYLTMQAPRHHGVISEGIGSDNPFLLYAVTYALFQSGTLGNHLDQYTPEIVSHIVSNLRNGKRPEWGNMYYVRTCLMLGEKVLPELEKAAESDTLTRLLVMTIRDHNREARDTIHLEYAYLTGHYLEGSKRSGGIIPLSAILYDVRPELLAEGTK